MSTTSARVGSSRQHHLPQRLRVPVMLWSGVMCVTLLSFGMHVVNAQVQRDERTRVEERFASQQASADEEATLAAVAHASPGTAR